MSRPKLLSPLHTCCCCHVNEMHIFSRSAPLEWKGKYLHYARGPECTRRPAIPLTRVYVQNNTVLTLISLLLSVKWRSEYSQVLYGFVLMCVCLCTNQFFPGPNPRLYALYRMLMLNANLCAPCAYEHF